MPNQWHGRAMPFSECHAKDNAQIGEPLLASEFGRFVGSGRRLKNLQVHSSGADQGGGGGCCPLAPVESAYRFLTRKSRARPAPTQGMFPRRARSHARPAPHRELQSAFPGLELFLRKHFLRACILGQAILVRWVVFALNQRREIISCCLGDAEAVGADE